jgi:hypothetical protein
MYFPVFGENQLSSLSEDLTYIVEALVSEMLANADVSTLRKMQREPHMVEMLLNELAFVGQISKADLPPVRDYLIKEESNLFEAIKYLAQHPDNEEIRQELCTARAMSPHKR